MAKIDPERVKEYDFVILDLINPGGRQCIGNWRRDTHTNFLKAALDTSPHRKDGIPFRDSSSEVEQARSQETVWYSSRSKPLSLMHSGL